MTINLPKAVRQDGRVKILTAANYGDELTELPYTGINGRSAFELVRFERTTLVGYDSCVFRHEFGRIFDREGLKEISEADNIVGRVIVIQVERDTDEFWTEWVGRCYARKDYNEPGSDLRLGYAEYHCTGIMKDLERIPVDYFATYSASNPSRGHPGFNTIDIATGDRDATESGATLGNASIPAHAPPRNVDNDEFAAPWTDKQAIEQLLAVAYGIEDFEVTVTDSQGTLGAVNKWEVKPQMDNVGGVIRRICAQTRGIYAFLDWDMAANQTRIEGLTLRAEPIFYNDITVASPGEDDQTINGASSAGTAVDIDLVGDHRLVDGSFTSDRVESSSYDVLESYGEYMQMAVTISEDDGTLVRRWTAQQETDYDDEKGQNSNEFSQKFATVGRSWQIKPAAGGQLGDGFGAGGTKRDANAYCDDDGNLDIDSETELGEMSITLLVDTPLLNGVDYSQSTAQKFSGETGNIEDNQRMPPLIMRWIPPLDMSGNPDASSNQKSTSSTFSDIRQLIGVNITNSGHRNRVMTVQTSVDQFQRLYGWATGGIPGSTAVKQKILVFTVGIELPNRIRRQSSRETPSAGSPRVKRMYWPGLHLHLLHSGCIYDLDENDNPKIGGLTSSGPKPGIIRDDRPLLAYRHAIASEWYLRERRTIGYSLRDQGFGSFISVDDEGNETEINYPRLGNLVHEVTQSGNTQTYDTPITRISYDHDRGVTSYLTGWAERDWRQS